MTGPPAACCFEVHYGPRECVVIAANEDGSFDVRRADPLAGTALDQHFAPGHPDYPQWRDFFADDAGVLGRPCRNPWRAAR